MKTHHQQHGSGAHFTAGEILKVYEMSALYRYNLYNGEEVKGGRKIIWKDFKDLFISTKEIIQNTSCL